MNTALPEHARNSAVAYRVALVLQGHAAFSPTLAGVQRLHSHPSGRAQARARFVRLGVRNAPPVAHRLGCAPHGAVEHAVRVGRAVGAGSVHLQRSAVVVVPRHWPPSCRHADEFGAQLQANTELPPDRRLVVPVVAGNELLRLAQRHRHHMGPNQAVNRTRYGRHCKPGRAMSIILPVRACNTCLHGPVTSTLS